MLVERSRPSWESVCDRRGTRCGASERRESAQARGEKARTPRLSPTRSDSDAADRLAPAGAADARVAAPAGRGLPFDLRPRARRRRAPRRAAMEGIDPTVPQVRALLLLDSEGKRIAVKYFSPEL